ncbi:hypothetical protein [Nocardiopsis lucentensis]|uniref:hypothetical protein n=1 Tax=Nocardiopsis lucentensis TaxID=53441 RepID=UPI000344AA1C|nr:hypothetical protein [Nocardiopsis lucentensis]
MKPRDDEFRTELIGRPFREGETLGPIGAIIGVLEVRDLEVGDEVRQRIAVMADRETLRVWGRRAAEMESAEDLFLRPSRGPSTGWTGPTFSVFCVTPVLVLRRVCPVQRRSVSHRLVGC